MPKLKPTIVYSEILNQYMKVTVTERTLKLIDEHYGFDHYILAVSCFYTIILFYNVIQSFPQV